ncbi:MAG: S8 family serine peptidase, partial [Pseudomonadota bacterium]
FYFSIFILGLRVFGFIFLAWPGLSSAQSAYYHDGKRKIPLVQVAEFGNKIFAVRSDPAGALKISDENFYVVYPKEWDARSIGALEDRYRLSPSGIRAFASIRFYRAASAKEAMVLANRIAEETLVSGSAPLWFEQVFRRTVQDDPLFAEQWFLHNIGQHGGVAGQDINVTGVWPDYDGRGVVLGVVDDGLELGHPDLAPNVSPLWHYDYVDNDADPTAGAHGTEVAGVAAARAFNGRGGRGVAPGAQLVGLRLLDEAGFIDELAEVEAFSNGAGVIDVFNNSWGPPDGEDGAFVGPSLLVRTAMEEAIAHGRRGLGNIFVWAAGNGGPTDNSNLDGYANLRYTIAVTATTNTGQAAPYAEPGANILVNAPSGGGSAEVATTDRTGAAGENSGNTFDDCADPDYTTIFSGTSSSAAVVSGLAALMLEANPGLSWRDVQAVLALSAQKNDPRHGSWKENGVGFPVSTQYGFGRVDAAAAVRTALAWRDPVAQEQESAQYVRNIRRGIPDNDPAGVSDSIEVAENLRVESVEVTVNIPDHTYWGDIDIRLVSPSGTEVQLASSRYLTPAFLGSGYQLWTLGDVLHAGELSRGTWRIMVSDREAADVGTLFSWAMKIYGTPVPETVAALPLGCAPRIFGTEAVSIGRIAAGVNHHGSQFSRSASGTGSEDFMILFGLQGVLPFTKAHAFAFHESGEGLAVLYVRTDAGWVVWNGGLADLPGFMPPGAAGSGGTAVLFHGRLGSGRYTVYVGYTSQQGELLYCPEPLQITVE